MARLHLKYRTIHRGVRRSADSFFNTKPWSGTDDEKLVKFNTFLEDACGVYGIAPPFLQTATEDSEDIPFNTAAPYAYDPEDGVIYLTRWSVTSLFSCFRQHLQAQGQANGELEDPERAYWYACSLFYSTRPTLFRKAVRNGTILGVEPADLLATGSTYTPPEPSEGGPTVEQANAYDSRVLDATLASLEEAEGFQPMTVPSYLQGYEEFLRQDGLGESTVRKHIRIAIAFLDHASEEGLTLTPESTVDEALAWTGNGDLTASSARTYVGSITKMARWKYGELVA